MGPPCCANRAEGRESPGGGRKELSGSSRLANPRSDLREGGACGSPRGTREGLSAVKGSEKPLRAMAPQAGAPFSFSKQCIYR